jgi:hypothetical protein
MRMIARSDRKRGACYRMPLVHRTVFRQRYHNLEKAGEPLGNNNSRQDVGTCIRAVPVIEQAL